MRFLILLALLFGDSFANQQAQLVFVYAKELQESLRVQGRLCKESTKDFWIADGIKNGGTVVVLRPCEVQESKQGVLYYKYTVRVMCLEHHVFADGGYTHDTLTWDARVSERIVK